MVVFVQGEGGGGGGLTTKKFVNFFQLVSRDRQDC